MGVAIGALVAAFLVAGLPLAAQQPAPVDSSVPLFTVMAAMNAAGYDTDLASPQNSPIRRQVRDDIAAAQPASLAALRAFYAAHRNPNAARDLSQFISFALLIGDPPDFAFRVREPDLPAEGAALRDLQPLLVQFYKEAGLEKLWVKYRPAYDWELAHYDEGLAQVMLEVNGYLRIASSGFLGRNFSIYVDLLGAPGQANARSFGSDYYVVLSPAASPQLEEVRHGYLHYVLEPMAGKYSALVRGKSELRAFAEEAPMLDPALRGNFPLLLSESLIRAAELRIAHIPPAVKQQRLREALAEGHILAPYFFEALEAFEKQDAGMRIYYPELVEKMDVRREQKRLAGVSFRQAQPEQPPHVVSLTPGGSGPAPRKAPTAAAPGAETAVSSPTSEEEQLLSQGEDALARSDFAQARHSFQSAVDKKGPLQGHALYGLGLVASQEKQPELAKTYFQRALETTRDPHVVAWANIYLGRIFDMEQNRELAIRHYQQALESGKADPVTRQAAERGLKAPFRREPAKRDEAESKG